MSAIFYNQSARFLTALVFLLAFSPLSGKCQDTLKTVDDFFNAGAYKYINNKSTEALKLVQKGLAIDSSDEKLKKLAELILKKDKNKQQQQQQQQQQQNKQDQNKDEDKDQDQNKDQQNQDQQDENENQQKQNNQLTKEDAERMLDALNNKDKDLQEKLDEQKAKSVNGKVEKDW